MKLGLSLGSNWDRRLSVDGTYIDYFQGSYASRRGLKNSFGVRVRGSECQGVVQINSAEPFTFGKTYSIPVKLAALPSHVRIIVDDHLLNWPNSDLSDVLIGKKSFQEALDW